MAKILQTGTYCSSNKGDAAMEFSMARALQAHLPGTDITISTPFPELDREAYAPLAVARCNRRRLIWGSFLLLRAWLWGRLHPWLGSAVQSLIANEELRATRDADLVIDLSGDMLTEDYGPHVAYSHFLPILIAGAMRRPYMLCAQSIGPFRYTKPLARRVLRGAALVTARETITRDYLREMGVAEDRIVMTTDMAFLLEPAAGERVRQVMQDEGIDGEDRPLLGISLSNLACNHYRKRNPNAASAEFTAMFARLLDTISAKYNYRIVFVPHVTGPRPSADDRLFATRIMEQMQAPAIVIRGDYTPDVLKGIISRCSAYMGARMHANIAALTSGIPTLAIGYSHKTEGIMQLLEQSRYVCDIATLDEDRVAACFAELHENRESISSTLLERAAQLRERAFHNIELAEGLLNKRDASDTDSMSASGVTRA
jgi:colanic acid/amylovoran biosynthesis protein